MQFLANENFPLPSVRALRAAGHSVVAVIEDSPGATDEAVLARCARENLVILTFDRDYGELVFRRALPVPAGVVYLRFDPASPTEAADVVMGLHARSVALLGRFTTVERGSIRQRSLPHRTGLDGQPPPDRPIE